MKTLTPRKRPQQARSRELVRAIVEGAARVFDREGLDATTNRIAEEAGVSIGSLYQYFPNKEALLIALAERHLDSAGAALRAVLQAHAASAELEALVRPLIQTLVAEHRTHPSMHRLIRQFAPRSPALMGRLDALLAEIERALAACLERRPCPPPLPGRRARFAIAAIDGVLHRTLPGDGIDEDYTEELVTLCCAFLCA